MRPFYFPIESGIYEVTPGLKPLGFDFGNGDQDAKIFQFDEDFAKAREEKLAARADDLRKYFATSRLTGEVAREAARTITQRLLSEWPQHFQLRGDRLHCALTGEVIDPSDLDALFMQIQEDGAILSVEDGRNWLSMIHVMLPSHWDPREKIGHDFATFHKPIPGFERLASAQANIAQAMIHKGPFVRFVWSFVTDTRLNHHPEPPVNRDAAEWRGRSFDSAKKEPFFLRIERQTTLGLTNVNAALFFIRLSFIDGTRVRADENMRTKLTSALRSMSPEARVYKGVATSFNQLINWLEKKD